MTDKTFKEMMAEKVSKNNEGRGVIVGIGPDYGRYVSIGDDRQWVDMSPSASQIKKYDKGQEGAQFDAAEKLIDRSAVGENPSTDVGTTKFEESNYEENGRKLAEGMQEDLKGNKNPTDAEWLHAFNVGRDKVHKKVTDPEIQELLDRGKTKTEPSKKSLSQMISEKNTTGFAKSPSFFVDSDDTSDMLHDKSPEGRHKRHEVYVGLADASEKLTDDSTPKEIVQAIDRDTRHKLSSTPPKAIYYSSEPKDRLFVYGKQDKDRPLAEEDENGNPNLYGKSVGMNEIEDLRARHELKRDIQNDFDNLKTVTPRRESF